MNQISAKQALSWLKKHMRTSIILLALLTLGCIVFWCFFSENQSSSQTPITYVDTVIVKPRAGIERWNAVGTVKAAQDILIASEVVGTIESLNVKSNQHINENDVIVTIQHDDVLAKLSKDKAILIDKKDKYQRIQALGSSKAASPIMVSEALSEFRQADANVQEDQALLAKYIIKAPFSGVVGIWQVDEGQLVREGDNLVTLSKLTPAYIDFMLPAKALSSIQIGNDIQFSSTAYPDRTWNGKVTAIEPRLDSITRGIQVRAEVDNSDNALVPSLYGQVTVTKPLPPQIAVPQEAINYEPSGEFVYVVSKQNIVKKQAVKLGTHEEGEVVIIDGLHDSDEVVTAGILRLFPEMTVSVKKRVIQTSTLTTSKP